MADEKKTAVVEDEIQSETAKGSTSQKDLAKKDASEKDAKAAKKKGPGFAKRFGKFFRDTKGEFKKVIWPTMPTVLRNTGVTLAMCAVIGLFVGLFDLGLSGLVKLMMSL